MSDLMDYLDRTKRAQQGAKDEQLNRMLNDVGLDATGTAIPDWQPLEKKTPTPQNLPSTSGLVRSVEDLWLGVREGSAGFYKLGANAFGLMDQAADKVSKWTGTTKGGAMGSVAAFLKDAAIKTAPTEEDLKGRDNFISYLYRAVGSAPVTVGTYAVGGSIAGSNVAGMAMIDALRHVDQGAWEAIKGGLQGALLGAGLKAIEPFSRPVRAVLGGTAFGGLTAAQGGGAAEIAAQAVSGAGLSALAPTPRKPGEMLKPVQGTFPAGTEGATPSRPGEIGPVPFGPEPSKPGEGGGPFVGGAAPFAPEKGVVSKRDVIRGEDLTKPKEPPIEMPDLTTEGAPDPVSKAMTAELESAKQIAHDHNNNIGMWQLLQQTKKNTVDPTVRKAVEKAEHQMKEEEKFGPIGEQVKQVFTSAKEPAEVSQEVMRRGREFLSVDKDAQLKQIYVALAAKAGEAQDVKAKVDTAFKQLGEETLTGIAAGTEKPKITVSGSDPNTFGWQSEGWYGEDVRSDPRAKSLFDKATKAIRDAADHEEAIKNLKDAGFDVADKRTGAATATNIATSKAVQQEIADQGPMPGEPPGFKKLQVDAERASEEASSWHQGSGAHADITMGMAETHMERGEPDIAAKWYKATIAEAKYLEQNNGEFFDSSKTEAENIADFWRSPSGQATLEARDASNKVGVKTEFDDIPEAFVPKPEPTEPVQAKGAMYKAEDKILQYQQDLADARKMLEEGVSEPTREAIVERFPELQDIVKKVEQTAAELDVTPQAVVNSMKLVENVSGYHGGTYRGGKITQPLYLSADVDMAREYPRIDMPGARVSEVTADVKKAASTADVLKAIEELPAEFKDPNKSGYTPDIVDTPHYAFDTSWYSEDAMNALIKNLKKKGFDHVVFADPTDPKYDISVLFPGTKPTKTTNLDAKEQGLMKGLFNELGKKLKDEKGSIFFGASKGGGEGGGGPKDPSRRQFLKGAAMVAGAIAKPKILDALTGAKAKELGVSKVIEGTMTGEGASGILILNDGTKIYRSTNFSDRAMYYDVVMPDGKIHSFDTSIFDYENWMGVGDPTTGVAKLGVSADNFAASGLPKSMKKIVELMAPIEQEAGLTPELAARAVKAKLSDIREHRRMSEYGTLDPQEIQAHQRQLKESKRGPSQEEVKQIEEHAQQRDTQEAQQRIKAQEQSIQQGRGQVYELSPEGEWTPARTGQEPLKSPEAGFSTFDINFAIARTLAGAAYGFSQGDTIEERLKNALIYSAAGALANPMMIKTIVKALRGMDPEGIKRIENRDKGMTPTVDQGFDPKAKMDVDQMAEFLRMTNQNVEVEGRINGINYDHINTPMDVKQVIGKMARVYQSQLDKIRRVEGVPHEETVAAAERLRGTKKGAPENIYNWPDGKPMQDRELLLTRMLRNDLGKELHDSTAKFLSENSNENLVKFIDTFNRYRMVQSVYAGQATGRGRSLEALKINVGNTGEVEFHHMLGDVIESIDTTGWTPQRLAGAIAQVPDMATLNKAVDIAARPGMHDMMLEAFYGVSMLSNPKTWVVNGTSAPIAYSWQVAKRSIAAGFTAAQGKIGNPEYVQPSEPLMMLQAVKDSFHDAFTVAKKAFVTGERQYPYSYGGKAGIARPNSITYDNLRAVYPKSFEAAESAMSVMGIDAQKLKYGIDLLGHTARLSTRLMLAPDEFNELIGARMELYARTARSTAAEGLTLAETANRARQKVLAQDGFSSADKEAAKTFALYNTFNQEPGSLTTRITGAIESLNKSPDIDPIWYLASKAVVPFITIPANVARWSARESGPTAFLSRQLKEDMAAGGARAQTAWAGVALGSMVLTIAANLAMNGYNNGKGPVQKADRQVWEADGNIEYSIKTPIGSFGYNRLDPIAVPFAWAADFVNLAGHIDAYDGLTLAASALLTMTHDMASKNYVQGVTNFLHAITSQDAKELNQYVKSATGGILTPGLVRGVRQETDPYRRATNTVMDAARASTPWGSTDYPIVLDRFARPIYSGYGAGPEWARMFGIINPIQYRAPNESAVIRQITENNIPIPGLSDTIYGGRDNPYDNKPADSRIGLKLEGWEYYQYNKYSGERLYQLLEKEVTTERWKNASPGPDGGKALIFRTLTAAADEEARQRLLKESPELMGAYRAKLGERKAALRPVPGQIAVPIQ